MCSPGMIMDSTSINRSQAFRPPALQEFLQISALNAFAIVQPVLDSLVNNVAYLRYYDYAPAAVILAVVLLTLTPAALLLCSRIVLHRMGRPGAADRIRTILMASLFLLAMMYAARWTTATFWLAIYGVSEGAFFLPAILGSLWLVRLYARTETFRQFLTVSAVGVLLFPAMFFLNPAIREQVLRISAREYFKPVVAASPVPVVFIVFDGLSGMALLDENRNIDRAQYPSFARMGDRCTVYRNASTVHTRTDHAVPAILSGSFPEGLQRPVESDYPTNLFRLLDNSRQFEQTIFEPYTLMAPQHLERIKRQESVFRQTFVLLDTVIRVYQRMCLPRFMESVAPDVPRQWFRLLPPDPADPTLLEGKIVYPWDTNHDLQVDHFIECLRPSEQPSMRFLHIVLPHDPWTHFGTGQQYRHVRIGQDVIPGEKDGNWGDDEWLVNQGWQRYLFQVQYADRCLGRILDRLEETGLFDKSMIVVTSDHGFAFRAGSSRRDPQADTIADLIPVPLLIKYPNQSASSVSERNVETIDILPTIADVLGLPNDADWDGESLLSDVPERPRKTIVGSEAFILEPDFPGRFQYVDRLNAAFARDSQGAFTNLQFLPELYGQDARPLVSATRSELTLQLSEGLLPDQAFSQSVVPCYYAGQISGLKSSDKPAILAVAVNGRICGTTRSSKDSNNPGEWAILMAPDVFTDATDRVQFFEVRPGADGCTLHELLLE